MVIGAVHGSSGGAGHSAVRAASHEISKCGMSQGEAAREGGRDDVWFSNEPRRDKSDLGRPLSGRSSAPR